MCRLYGEHACVMYTIIYSYYTYNVSLYYSTGIYSEILENECCLGKWTISDQVQLIHLKENPLYMFVLHYYYYYIIYVILPKPPEFTLLLFHACIINDIIQLSLVSLNFSVPAIQKVISIFLCIILYNVGYHSLVIYCNCIRIINYKV